MGIRGWATAAAFAATVAGAYAGSCWVFPFAHCRVCSGSGKRLRHDGKVFRPCRWCKGTGRRLRIGRRLWNRVRRLHRDAS